MKTLILMMLSFVLWVPAERADPVAGEPLAPEMKKRLVVDVERSVIHWKGTKFWGTRSHEGIVRLADGELILNETTLLAGRFVIDMRTIEVTDIPKTDPIPRRRLREHLKDEDFFNVDRFPTAEFKISAARRDEADRYRITGSLTMRGITHGVSFDAHIPLIDEKALRATAQISINRQDWGVAYRGSRLTNDLVDDTIELSLVLVANRPGTS